MENKYIEAQLITLQMELKTIKAGLQMAALKDNRKIDKKETKLIQELETKFKEIERIIKKYGAG